jgi:homoserine acetyltransferase
MSDERLIEDMRGLAAVKAPEVAEWAETKAHAAYVGFSMGAQWALELAAIDPEVALRLIRIIHEMQTEGNSKEWNHNALVFIQRAHDGSPPPSVN